MNEKLKKIYQFQVGYMLNPGLDINNEFKEKIESNLEKTISSATMTPIIRVLKKQSTHIP